MKIRKEIAKRYELDPKDWRLLWSIDKNGYYDLLIAKDSDLWWTKEQQLNPFLSVGCGVKRRLDEDILHDVFDAQCSSHPYGFRPVPDNKFKRMIRRLAEGKDLQAPILEILRSEPKPLKEIGTPFLMQGPFQQVPTLIDLLSDKQKELDAKLSSELKKLIFRHYPQLLMPYT